MKFTLTITAVTRFPMGGEEPCVLNTMELVVDKILHWQNHTINGQEYLEIALAADRGRVQVYAFEGYQEFTQRYNEAMEDLSERDSTEGLRTQQDLERAMFEDGAPASKPIATTPNS